MGDLNGLLIAAFSTIAAVGAVGFIGFRQPVHAALSFAVTVLAGAGLYLLLEAPYTAVATVIVYAGATIIIFLFALMFAQQSSLQIYDRERAYPVLSAIAAITLSAIIINVVSNASFPSKRPVAEAGASDTAPLATGSRVDSPRVADLGRVMYTKYLWAMELAGAILLVATLGAIHIAREDSLPDTETESVPS